MAEETPAPPPAPPAPGSPAPSAAGAPKPPAAAGAAAKPAAKPAAPKGPAPVDASGKPLVANISMAVPGAVVAATEFMGQTTVEVTPAKLVDVCRHLKDSESFTYLVDLTAVDWKDRQPRFDILLWMHSFKRGNERLRLRVRVGESCPSATAVWKAANWMEREVFDLFGIRFEGHPDMRRILTWDGFLGHPLRKDFPIEGIDTGAAIYPDRYPEGGGPAPDDPNRKVLS